VAIVAISVTTEFVQVLPPASLLLRVWSTISNGGVVVVFLVSFRGRYITLDPAPESSRSGATPLKRMSPVASGL
jgi:hypothetical protein